MSDAKRRTSVPPPRDVVDGIPDRATGRRRWKYLLIAAAFAGWMGLLVALFLLGRPGP